MKDLAISAVFGLFAGAILSLVMTVNQIENRITQIEEKPITCGLEPAYVCDSIGYLYYESLVR